MSPDIIGKTHKFEDGDSITVIQIKIRDENEPWVTYHVQQGPGIPRKLVMKYEEFVQLYGHLFGLITEDSSDPEVS
jgi:hypothetical protein